MLYYILKVLIATFYRVFYKIDCKGMEHVPGNKPVVLAPNHVNGFIDPVILAMLLPQKVRFFARGDVFKGKFAKWILNKMNISPMYRMQEGYGELKKNDKTFEECRSLLSKNKSLLMFPEGICVQEKRLRPLKKGLARIVFQTEESFDFKKDVLVVPVGLNYRDARRFRSRVFLDFGKPISIKDWEQRYNEDRVRTINEFTKYLEGKMKEVMVIIDNPENDELVEEGGGMWAMDKGHGTWDDERGMREHEGQKKLAEMLNAVEKSKPDLIAGLRQRINNYDSMLRKLRLRDSLLKPEAVERISIWNFIFEFLVLYLGMPVYFIGLAFNYLPYWIAKRATKKRVKQKEFEASFYCNIGLFGWMIWWILQLVVAAVLMQNWLWVVAYGVGVIMLGVWVLLFYDVKGKILGRWRLLRLVRKDRTKVEELVAKRAEIMQMMEILKKTYSEK